MIAQRHRTLIDTGHDPIPAAWKPLASDAASLHKPRTFGKDRSVSWPWTFIVGFVLPISGFLVLIGLFNLAARLRPTDRFAFKREWLRDGAVAVLPLAIAGTLAALTFIWDPDGTQFPSVEFYVVSAEILALLLIALILERDTIRDLKGWLRLEYALILLAGGAAALTRVADVVQEPSAWAEGTFLVLTTSALINTVTLVLFAVWGMDEARNEP